MSELPPMRLQGYCLNVIPAKAGIQETVRVVISGLPPTRE